MLDSRERVLSTTLVKLVLWNGRLPPLFATLGHLQALKLEYFAESAPVRVHSTQSSPADRLQHWNHLDGLQKLTKLTWNVLADYCLAAGREIAARLPNIQNLSRHLCFAETLPSYQNLTTLNVGLHSTQLRQLFYTAREERKLRNVSTLKCSLLDPVAFRMVFEPTLLWPKLSVVSIYSFDMRAVPTELAEMDAFVSTLWQDFCAAYLAFGAANFTKILGPVTLRALESLSAIAFETLQALTILPLCRFSETRPCIFDSWLPVIAKFVKLRHLRFGHDAEAQCTGALLLTTVGALPHLRTFSAAFRKCTHVLFSQIYFFH